MTPSHLIRALGLSALALLAAAPITAQAPAETKVASLTTAEGMDAGTATFTQTLHGVMIVLDLKNLTPGPHGLHLHEKGMCTPDFKAAGGHFNPLDAEHGFMTEGGYHVGDLPNVDVTAEGTAKAEIFVPQINVGGADNNRYPYTLADADGTAVMIHAGADDYMAMASSGDRMACGVVVPPKS
ncbi:MAG: superoxide dismutase family protein [Sphingomonadales bacterium]|nr:superoxide dismutase family protein [Sphingomonadales bacterium]NCQ21682.1 superoxide dismutase family protein [Sphingomonadales bacterium]NCT04394.1 superoxide dismutase family protein [Sphingomonadales bacterium]